jgi:hypothetical protein
MTTNETADSSSRQSWSQPSRYIQNETRLRTMPCLTSLDTAKKN